MKGFLLFSLCFLSVLCHNGYADETTPSPDPVTETIPTSESTNCTHNSCESASTTVTEPVSDVGPSETPTEPSSDANSTISTTTVATISNLTKADIVNKLSQQVRDILRHFQDPEPVGFPGQTVLEDPLSVPNKNISLGFADGQFYNMSAHGMSNFTVEAVNIILDQMEIYMMIRMKKIYIVGNCTVDSVIGLKSQGPFNITLTNVTAEGTVFLKVEPDGTLVTNKSVSDMNYDDLIFKSETGGLLQSALSGAGMALLAALKPYILKQIDERIGEEVNKQLKKAPKMPAMVHKSPVDTAIMEGRKFVALNYEPFVINKSLKHNSTFLFVKVGPVTVHGLSKFSRVGSVTLQMVNSTVVTGVRLITSRLRGNCEFAYDFGKIGTPRNNGQALFSLNHLQISAKINQSINIRQHPVLDDLQLEMGKITVRLDGNGKFEYLLETVLRYLPQLLRHLLVDAMEEPLKHYIQTEILDKMDVEDLFQKQLPMMETVLMNIL